MGGDQGGGLELTLYLPGGLEPLLRTDPGGSITRTDELHISDSATRLAVLRIGPPLPGDQRPALGYQLSDPLGSSLAVLDGSGQPVNREEYAPYGETTFGSYARKRYRYTGRERDEESGLEYHGQRFYAPWLARWISCDPLGTADGPNPYRYAHDRPTARVDPTGLAAKAPDATGAKARGGGRVAKSVNRHQVGDYHKMKGSKIGGTEPTVQEHGIPGAQLKALTKDPATGTSDYGPKDYAHDTTYANPKSDAAAKTHEHGSVPSDNARSADISARQTVAAEGKGPGVSLNEDLVLPSVTRAVETGTPEGVAGTAILSQVGKLFSKFSLREAGARVARSGSRARGSITVETAAGMAGGALTVFAAVQTAATLHSAYQESVQAHSYTPLAKATVHEAGSWGGGFVGGFLLGAPLGVGTGPGAVLTGLVGGALGPMGAPMAGAAPFEQAQHVGSEITALPGHLDNFVKTMLLPAGPKPWGNW